MFIPLVGIVGGAAAALVGSLVLFIGTGALGSRTYPIPVAWTGIVMVGLIVLVVDILAIALDFRQLDAIAPRIVMFAVCVLLVIGLGPISLGEMRGVSRRIAARWQGRAA